MRKNFGGKLGKQPGKIVVLFTRRPGRQFEHALAAAPQLLGITRRCHLTRPIRHLVHLSKKRTLPRLVPDISPAKPFHDPGSKFPALFRRLAWRRLWIGRSRGGFPKMRPQIPLKSREGIGGRLSGTIAKV